MIRPIFAALLLSVVACARPAIKTPAEKVRVESAAPAKPTTFKMISLHAYYFDNDMDRIDDTDSPMFKRNIEAIKASPIPSVRILGHTDTRGPEEYNRLLALSRAHALAAAYVAAGIPEYWIQIESAGETLPICLEDTDRCHARNRRVETYATVQISEEELNTP